ncbi:AzlC family ABC transporter permease [Mitsuokella sp. WILCCON 0060]|uniref:AzlC family ABC transporter permease n=1 Tax=unclassified Mitsuokella TaxID=2637239 RepID=UPI003F01F9AB
MTESFEPTLTKTTRQVFFEGVHDGTPIALGYFVVSFTLGIAARNAGLDPLQGFLASFFNNASAGEYAGFTVIAADAPYLEIILITLVANARYMLMSCALSQKFPAGTSIWHRIFVGFDVTDEIFGITIARKGPLNPYYNYGAMALALPGWAVGTALGVVAGNILPPSVVSALSVALYGMFLWVIIPPAKKNRIVGGLVLVSFALSYLASVMPMFSTLSGGTRTIILTIVIAGLGAAFFPIPEKADSDDAKKGEDA